MTAYARSDVRLFVSPLDGHTHERVTVGRGKARVPADSFAIDCPSCEAILLGDQRFADQWAARPEDVPMTPDEQRARERELEEGTILQQQVAKELARGIVDAARERVPA